MSSVDRERIETHCTSCGALLKAKLKYAGRSLRCPKCKGVNMVPFSLDDSGSVVAKPRPSSSVPRGPVDSPGGPSNGIKPLDVDLGAGRHAAKIAELDNLLRSIYKCFEDAFERGQNVLSDVGLTPEKKEGELLRVRRDLAAAMRSTLVGGLKSMQDKAVALGNHPMADSASVRAQREETEAALEGYRIFAKCMFDLKT